MAEKKPLQLALDNVPFGTTEENEQWKKERIARVPEGVRESQLYRDTLKIAWPSLVELVLTQLASMVDMMMVGKLGYTAVTAVGLTTQPIFLLMALLIAMNVGTTALVARNKGAGKQKVANLIMRQALLMIFVISVIMSVIGFVFAEPMVVFMGAKSDTVVEATEYLKIRMASFVFLGLTASITASLRGAGDSRTAMIYNVIANVVNVIFNYLLIYGKLGFPRLETAGAAWATDIGQVVAFVVALVFVMTKGKKKYLHLRLRDGFRPDPASMRNIIQIGIPSLVEQLVMRTGMIIFAKTVANLGTMAYATHQICMNIQALSFMVGNAFAVSATSLVGQSLGKKRADMARLYGFRTALAGFICSCVLLVTFFFFGGAIVSLYNDEPEVVRIGSNIMRFVAFIQPFQGTQFIMAGALRGAGDTKSTAWITFVTVLVVRAGLALLLVYVFDLGLYGAWIALAVDQLLRTALVGIRYYRRKWMDYKLKAEQ